MTTGMLTVLTVVIVLADVFAESVIDVLVDVAVVVDESVEQPASDNASSPIVANRDNTTIHQGYAAVFGHKLIVAGVVIQWASSGHPPAVSDERAGVRFLSLEDETGLMNTVVSKGCWAQFRNVARGALAMVIASKLERM